MMYLKVFLFWKIFISWENKDTDSDNWLIDAIVDNDSSGVSNLTMMIQWNFFSSKLLLDVFDDAYISVNFSDRLY